MANDLKRARRARGPTIFHAELALRDLAARLRHPSPSLRRWAGGGVESAGAASPEGEPSDGGQQIAREQEQIEELARDHGAERLGVEQALNRAESGEELDKLRDEAGSTRKRCAKRCARCRARGASRTRPSRRRPRRASTPRRWPTSSSAGAWPTRSRAGATLESALEQAERAPADRFSFRGDIREDAKGREGSSIPR